MTTKHGNNDTWKEKGTTTGNIGRYYFRLRTRSHMKSGEERTPCMNNSICEGPEVGTAWLLWETENMSTWVGG